jgi:hypothetical protein
MLCVQHHASFACSKSVVRQLGPPLPQQMREHHLLNKTIFCAPLLYSLRIRGGPYMMYFFRKILKIKKHITNWPETRISLSYVHAPYRTVGMYCTQLWPTPRGGSGLRIFANPSRNLSFASRPLITLLLCPLVWAIVRNVVILGYHQANRI